MAKAFEDGSLPKHLTALNTHQQKRCRTQKTVAKYNSTVIAKLKRALEKDPSADLEAIFPKDYVSRRTAFKSQESRADDREREECSVETVSLSTSIITNLHPDPEVFVACAPGPSATVMFELSDQAVEVLAIRRDEVQDEKMLAMALTTLMNSSTLLCCPTTQTLILRCDDKLVVKCFVPNETRNGLDSTEYTSLHYLQRNLPGIPAPRPHGLITSGDRAYLFMTYIPGQTLETTWPDLTSDQKRGIQDELQKIVCEMRRHYKPDNMPLGGPGGEGCKDTRRSTKISNGPPTSVHTFWEFVYGLPKGPSASYIQAVQPWLQPRQEEQCVFTHGDIRPANVHVSLENGCYRIVGLLDWEKSGFYPESWESCKITNCMSTLDLWDWFSYLPICISPAQFAEQWLRDHFWDRYLVHQSGLV